MEATLNCGSVSSSEEPELKRCLTDGKMAMLKERVMRIMTLQHDRFPDDPQKVEASMQERVSLFYEIQGLFQLRPTTQLQRLLQDLCRSTITYAQKHSELLNDRRVVVLALAYQCLFSNQAEIIAYYDAHHIGRKVPELYCQAGVYYEFQVCDISRAIYYYTLGYNNCTSPRAKKVFKTSIRRLKAISYTAEESRLFVWAPETSPQNLSITNVSAELCTVHESCSSPSELNGQKPIRSRVRCKTLPIFILTYSETANSFISPEEQHLLDLHMCFVGRLIARKQLENLNPYSQLANDPHIISRMVYTLSPRCPILLYTSRQGPTQSDLVISNIIEPYYIPRAFYFALVDMAPSLQKSRIVLTFMEEVDVFPTNPEIGSTLMICPYQVSGMIDAPYPVVYPKLDSYRSANERDEGINQDAREDVSMEVSTENTPNDQQSNCTFEEDDPRHKANCKILLTLTELLGAGAFGKVFAADALHSSRPDQLVKVAVKFFTRKKDSIVVEIGERAVCAISTSFLREIYSLSALTLRLADSLSDCLYTRFIASIVNNQGLGAFVMEYIPGVTLFELCKQCYDRSERGLTCLPEDVILWISYLMIKTVKTFHEANIVHTDIKVDNWLVTVSTDAMLSGSLKRKGERSGRSAKQKARAHSTIKQEAEWCEHEAEKHPALKREEDSDYGEDNEFLVPVACDFGKAVDASLFTLNDVAVRFHYTSMSVVTPCPIVEKHWLYEPDYSGVASCIWYMITGTSVKPSDLSVHRIDGVRTVEVALPSKRYWKHVDLLTSLLSQLFSFSTDMCESYSTQRRFLSDFTGRLLKLIESAIEFSEVVQFTETQIKSRGLGISQWKRRYS
ncbi:Kinase [Giardia duodenalis assemblage B]|uniref:Kinase n=1 Tax=Giardia duodenalis assemblage B TaxID=1394984 RepID=A0A132NTY9_GIAIN|nr:Kinase [Giardia intestinalis assemblage B]